VEGDRTFRYSKNGAVALSKALMTHGTTSTDGEVTKTKEIVQTGHAWAVGDTSGTVLVTTGGVYAKNEYAGGLMYGNKVAAIGDMYRIIASEQQATDTIMNIELDTPIRTAISVTTEVTLQTNKYSRTVVFDTSSLGFATGVPLIDVTAEYYYWAQTGGPAPILVDDSETVVIGDKVGPPGTYADAGSCGVYVTIQQHWGHVLSVGPADEPAIVDLDIDN